MLGSNTLFFVGGGLGLVLFVVGLVSLIADRGSVVDERLGRYAESGGAIAGTLDEGEEKQSQTSIIIDFIKRAICLSVGLLGK